MMMQAGWPARFLFTLCVKSVNDMDNRTLAPAFARNEDPDYARLIDLLEKIQKSGAVGSRIEKKDKQETVVLFFRRKAGRNIDPELAEAGRLLGLKPGTTDFKVLYGNAPMREGEIAILTRSILDMILELSAQIEVPPEQASEGRTYARSPEIGDGKGQRPPFIRVRCTKDKPSDRRQGRVRNVSRQIIRTSTPGISFREKDRSPQAQAGPRNRRSQRFNERQVCHDRRT